MTVKQIFVGVFHKWSYYFQIVKMKNEWIFPDKNNTAKKLKIKTWLFFQKTFIQIFVQNGLTNGLGTTWLHFFWLFFALLSWPNLTCSNRPLSSFFHTLTPPRYPLFCCVSSENWKMEIKRSGVQLLNILFLA